ncbi:MAG: hypothetical protein FWG64_09630 [Firmicutes bacterium]|nr:hypothetical protein [Bacillota bacterium]
MTAQDYIFAAILALILTWFIKGLVRVFTFAATRTTVVPYKQVELDLILTKCYMLFPIESLIFNGNTFERGMSVRVETNRTTTLGTFLGVNKNNLVGFITPDCVITHELEIIEDITEIQ